MSVEEYQPRSILEVIIAGIVIAALYWLKARADKSEAGDAAGQAADRVAAAYGGLVDDLQQQITDLRNDQGKDRARITALEDREVILIGWIRLVHNGIGDGTIPPLPEVPEQVRRILGL